MLLTTHSNSVCEWDPDRGETVLVAGPEILWRVHYPRWIPDGRTIVLRRMGVRRSEQEYLRKNP